MKLTLKSNLLRSTMIASAVTLGALVVPFAGTTAFAQDYTSGAISGTVYSNTGQNLSGKTLTLESSDRGFTRTAVTDAAGQYRFPRLPIGNYTVALDGGATETIRIAVGSTTRKDFVVGGNIDEVIATGTVVKVHDFEAATTGLTIDVEETFKVTPLARNITALTLLTPGAASGDSAFGNLVSLGGSSVAENVYYVNGMNTTDFRNFLGSAAVPFEFYEQVQTKTGGLPAEFGRTTGGVSNAVTKSGSNDWHFGASVYHSDDRLRSEARNTRFLDTSRGLISANASEIREDTEMNLWASGPIVEDRVFAYGLYSPRSRESTSNNAFGGRSTTFTSDNPFYGGKLDVVLTDEHLLEFTGWKNFNESKSSRVNATFDSNGEITGTSFGSSGAPIEGISESGGELWMGKYTGQLTDWLTVSAMYGEQTNAQTTSSAADIYPAIYDARSGSFVNVGQNASFSVVKGNDKRELFRTDADIYVDDLLGQHHFRIGYDRENLTAVSERVNSGGVYYAYRSASTCDAQRATPTGDTCVRIRDYKSGGEFEVATTAYYLQDSWEIRDDLTLNLGIRNETFENFNATGDAFIAVDNQWAPRLSFAYQPSMDSSGTLFGSYSKYFLPVAANTNIRSAGAETFIHTWHDFGSIAADWTPNGVGASFSTQVFGDGTAPAPDSLVDANIKPQNMDEFVIGYSTDLDDKFDGELGNWSVGAAFTHNTLNRVIEDISIDAGVLNYCADNNIAGCAAIFGPRTLHQYVLTNPGHDVSVVVDDLPGGPQRITLTADQLGYPGADRTYDGLELKFDRVNADDGLNLHASWTISESKGNYEGAVKSDNGQDDTGLTTDYDFPELMVDAYGFLPNHRLHKMKVYGNYEVTENFSVGANLQIASPRKYGCLGQNEATNDLYGDAWTCPDRNGSGALVATPRGSKLESDWSNTVDLNLSYTIPTITTGSMSIRADIFNLFDNQYVSDLKETDSTPFGGTLRGSPFDVEYGRATGYKSPRYVRLGVDWRY